MPEFVSPGGAFTSSFNESLLQDAAMKRQAMLDDLTKRRTESEISLGQEALKDKRAEAAERIREKERGETERDIAGMAPGDIPDADLVSRAKKHHIPLRVEAVTPTAKESLPGIAAVPSGQVQEGITPTRTGLTPNPEQGIGGTIRYAGSPKQAEEAAKQKKIDAIIQQIKGLDPVSPQFKDLAAQYEMIAGKLIPAAMMTTKTGGVESEAIMRQHPSTGQVQRQIDGHWIDWTHDAPKGAHWMTVPETSARDAAREATKGQQLQTTREHAYSEINKWAAPIEGHLDAIRSLGTMLNAKTPEADKLVAPLVIKATIAGQGSGFRMTRAEIESVIGGRSRWESLSAALNQWSLDPAKALSLTDTQRDDLRTLTKKIRDKATKLSRQITDARHTIDDAEDGSTVNHARTSLQEALQKMDDDAETPASPTATMSDEDRVQHYLKMKPGRGAKP